MKRTAMITAMAMAGALGVMTRPFVRELAEATRGPPAHRATRPIHVPRVHMGHIGPSRYMPHIGAKERARYAGWPDGPMHRSVSVPKGA